MPPSTTSRSTPTARSTAPWRKTASSVSTGHTFPHLASPGPGCVGRGGSVSRTNCVLLQQATAGAGTVPDGAVAKPLPPLLLPELPRGRSRRAAAGADQGTPNCRGFAPAPLYGLGQTSPRRFASSPAGSTGPRSGRSAPSHPPTLAPAPRLAGWTGQATPERALRDVETRLAAEGLSLFGAERKPQTQVPLDGDQESAQCGLTDLSLALAAPGTSHASPAPSRTTGQPVPSSLSSPRLVSHGGLELPRTKSHLSPLTCAGDRR